MTSAAPAEGAFGRSSRWPGAPPPTAPRHGLPRGRRRASRRAPGSRRASQRCRECPDSWRRGAPARRTRCRRARAARGPRARPASRGRRRRGRSPPGHTARRRTRPRSPRPRRMESAPPGRRHARAPPRSRASLAATPGPTPPRRRRRARRYPRTRSEVRLRGQARVVLGQARGGRRRSRQVLKPRELELAIERSPPQVVEQLRHVVGEVLRSPHPPQRGLGVSIERRAGPGAVPVGQRRREQPRVVDGQVKSLRPRRRDDVRGVAGEEPSARHCAKHWRPTACGCGR